MTSELGPAELRRQQARSAAAEARKRVAGIPSLHLMVWPTVDALRLSLVLYYTTLGQRRTCTVLRSAEWRPREVTQRLLVEWGQRALADWLANPTETEVGDRPFAFGRGQLGG